MTPTSPTRQPQGPKAKNWCHPTQSTMKPIPITKDTPPQFPCWLLLKRTGWQHFNGSIYGDIAAREDATHWLPDQPDAPTATPTTPQPSGAQGGSVVELARAIVREVNPAIGSMENNPEWHPSMFQSRVDTVLELLSRHSTAALAEAQGELDVARAERKQALLCVADLKANLRTMDADLSALSTVLAKTREALRDVQPTVILYAGKWGEERVASALALQPADVADELAALRKRVEELQELAINGAGATILTDLRSELATAKQQLAEAGKDREDLDWIQATGADIDFDEGTFVVYTHDASLGSGASKGAFKSVRAAIRAARTPPLVHGQPRSINNPEFIRDCSPGGGDLSGCSA